MFFAYTQATEVFDKVAYSFVLYAEQYTNCKSRVCKTLDRISSYRAFSYVMTFCLRQVEHDLKH